MKKYFYSLVLSSTLFYGCSKEEVPFALEGKYQAGTTVLTAPIQMFTKDGVVDNQVVVDHFLRRRVWAAGYFSRVDVPAPTGSLTLTIMPNKCAVLIEKTSTHTDSIKTTLTSQTAQYLVLSHADSVTGAGVSTKSPSQSPCELLAEKIKSEYAGIHYYPISYATGEYKYIARVRPIEVITVKDAKLFLPQFSWLVESTRYFGSGAYNSKCGISQSGEHNVFNSAVVNQLAAGDTIVVQERSIPLQKK